MIKHIYKLSKSNDLQINNNNRFIRKNKLKLFLSISLEN